MARLGPPLVICGVGSRSPQGAEPEAMMVVDRLDRQSDIRHDFFLAPGSRDTTLSRKVQRPLSFVYMKEVLRLRLAVNEKSQRRHTLLSTSVTRKAVLYASEPLTKVKNNRVERFSISFPRCVYFCFTSQKLIKIL